MAKEKKLKKKEIKELVGKASGDCKKMANCKKGGCVGCKKVSPKALKKLLKNE